MIHGYTGTNFNRPDFQRMIADIKLGKINMVITKDLSRLGRDYIETGEYVEKWFPQHNIRYISVTDGIDTFAINNSNNDIAPFKAILNDMYSKDLSKKIKTAFHTMQKEGKWVAGKTPLGYIRNPKDKNHLIICEKEANIVRIIFKMAIEGKEVGTIKKYLNDNEFPTANHIRYNKASFWENKTVKQILTNEVYVGTTIQNRRSRISYKNRKLRPNPEEQWQIVENTHEPIVDKEIFNRIQKMVITQRYNRNDKKNTFLLDGLLFCYECGHKVGIKDKKKEHCYMVCNNYRRYPKLKVCTCHGFSYERLEELVLQHTRKLFLDIDSKKIELDMKNRKNKYNYKKLIEKIEIEIKTMRNNLDKMYIDKLDNKISEEMYDRIHKKLDGNIIEKEKEYLEFKKLEEQSKEEDSEKLKKTIKEFLALEKPTPELMKVIINKIDIHQDKQVDITFNFKKLNYFLNSDCLI